MDVELLTDETSEDENYGLDDYSEDILNYEGERCGICMDVVIDRGVLDCCQHWFCFPCIDNWATITSLCPLCQNEFQLITCVPVYDTVGGNKSDEETNPRDDDWFVEGKTNTLSFPSYYIDENAVVCLDGDGCKIRSGSVAIEEDSDIDTSIACDSCDKWYHAFCVGFDPEGTSDSSWLCPRCTCTVVKVPQSSDRVSVLRTGYQNDIEAAADDYLAEASFSGRVSVSVADDGETAVVISLVEGNKEFQESGESAMRCSEGMEKTLLSSSTSKMLNVEAIPGCNNNSLDPSSCQQGIELSLSRDNCCPPSHSVSPAEQNIIADDAVETVPRHLDNKNIDPGLGLDLFLSVGSDVPVHMKDNDLAEDHVAGSLQANNRSEDLFPVSSAENVVCDEMEAFSIKTTIPDETETISGATGAKRLRGDSRNEDDGEREARLSRKKIKAERNSLPSLTDRRAVSFLDDSHTISSRSSLGRGKNKCKPDKESGTSDIMDIIQETDRKSVKQLGESVAGLRLKKIMRRADDGKDSLVLVQELRKKIREAVRYKSSKEMGQNLFDPKLLDAFRAAVGGSGAENRKPTLDMKAKRSLLQKGKVRESLTKKYMGLGESENELGLENVKLNFGNIAA